MLEYWFPTLQTSTQVFSGQEKSIDYFLKGFKYIVSLAIPMTTTWILGFYLFFHLLLNIFSEITYFADRNFYNDWWNCKNLADYWRDWNLPVHQFFKRHIFYPLQYRGVSKDVASTLVFLVSAGIHEYAVSLSIGKMGWMVFFTFAM